MKRKFLFFWISSLLLNWTIGSANPLLKLADELMRRGCPDAAITEYKRFLFFEPQADSAAYIFRAIADSYYALGDKEAAIQNLKMAITQCAEPDQGDEWTIRLSLWYLEIHHEALAEIQLEKLVDQDKKNARPIQPDTVNKAALLLFLLQLEKGEVAGAVRIIAHFTPTDSLQVTAKSQTIIALENLPSYRSPGLARKLSTFLPGAGQIYVGAYGQGLNALILNGLIGWQATRLIVHEQYLQALLLCQYFGWRYYSGNRYHAERLAREYNHEQFRHYRLTALRAAQPLFHTENGEMEGAD